MAKSLIDNMNNDVNSLDKEFENSIRPKEMEAFAGQPQLIENLSIFIKAAKIRGEALDHILFHGPPGLGKTSLAKVLAKNYPTLYINVSDESSVETIRVKINDFCSTISVLDGKSSKKIVVLDEFDGASDQFYKALRGTIEKFAGNARFIAT